MRIYLEAFDAAGNRLGDGPISTLTGAQVTRILDGVGTIQFETPATDERALTVLTPRTHFRLYSDNQGVTREVGRGMILKREMRENEGGAVFVYACADALVDLKSRTTHVGRTYSQVSVGVLVADLVGLVPNWSAVVAPEVAALTVDARFDGVSVLDALVELCENNGIHFRLAAAGNVLEVGAFGTDSGVTVLNAESISEDMYARAGIALVQGINAGADSEDLVNWIVPLGAGEDVAALTLENSTRTSPYPIHSGMGPDGRTFWYLQDDASIAAHGRNERYTTFKNILPISNSEADKVAAADMLYDAAVAYLARSKQLQETYDITLIGVKDTLRAGDLVTMRYRGNVLRDGGIVQYANLDGPMYVLRVTENFGFTDSSVSVEISNVDVMPRTIEEDIVRTMNEITLRGLRPAVGTSCRSYVYPREIAPNAPCIVPVEVSNATLGVTRVRVRLKTMPLRATASTAAAGGDHNHRVAVPTSPVGFPGTTPNPYLARNSAGGALLYLLLNTNNPSHEFWTDSSSGAHTHQIAYGVRDDTITPVDIGVWVDGIDRTTALGGPWAAGGGNQNILLDVGLMTGYITHAAGGMYGEHAIEFRCLSGHGRCEVTVEIYEVLQGIDPQ